MKMRLCAALVVLVSAVVHLQLWFDGVRYQHGIGPLFLVNVFAGAAIAVLLVGWRHWIPLFLAVGFGATTLGAFIIASTVGLFEINTDWHGFRVWAAAIAEVLAVLTGLLAAHQEGYLSRAQLQRRSSTTPGLR